MKLQRILIEEINQLHAEIEGYFRKSLDNALLIGQRLAELKETLSHGEFTPWVEANLTFTSRTARNYMKLHNNRDRIESAGGIKEAYQLLTETKTETVSVLEVDDELMQLREARIQLENALLVASLMTDKGNGLDMITVAYRKGWTVLRSYAENDLDLFFGIKKV